MMVKTDVVIPARNEESTIGAVVKAFRAHRRIGKIIVAIDADTNDDTYGQAYKAGAFPIQALRTGKGQVVTFGLSYVQTRQVIFSDADYQGMTTAHVNKLLWAPHLELNLIGVPDLPPNYPDAQVWAWPWCSGLRRIPTEVARSVTLYGYCMEVVLNAEAQNTDLPTLHHRMWGLESPYRMTDKRKAERDRDLKWLQERTRER